MHRLKVLYTILVSADFVLLAYFSHPYWLPFIAGDEYGLFEPKRTVRVFTMTTARDILESVTGADKRFAHSLAQKPEPPGEEPDPALIRAVERIRKVAEQGFAHAQFSIAERFRLPKCWSRPPRRGTRRWSAYFWSRAPIRSSPTTRGATPSSTRTWGGSGKESTS